MFILKFYYILSGCLCSINDGLIFAWSSPYSVKITNDTAYNITEQEASYFAIIPTISMMVACTIFATLANVIGRKTTLLLISIPAILSWVLKAVATNATVFYIAQVFTGFDLGCFFAVLPMYAGEICNPAIRGRLGSLVTSLNCLGQFLINVMGNNFNIPTTSYICLPLPILFFVLFWFMPESPYFYIMKGKHEEAKNSLRKLTRKKNIEADFMKLKNDVERQMSERGTWKDLIMIPSNRRALLAGVFLRTSQCMGGTFLFTTSVQFFFEKTSGILSPGTSAMIYSFFTFASFLLAGVVIDKLGRRIAYSSSMVLTSVMLLLESLYFYMENNLHKDVSAFNWFPLVGFIIYIVFASIGPGIVPTLMMSELFSASIKVKANILMVFLIALASTICSTIFYSLFSVTGLSGPFLLYGLANLISAVISYLYLPETKGKTLEEIQQMLKGNK